MQAIGDSNKLSLLNAGVRALSAVRALVNRRGFAFQGKVVLITGGSRGLGLVMARQLAREGARLAICARDADELERAREELAGIGAEVLALTCDVTERTQVEAAVRMVVERLGPVDVLINNAGVIQVGPMELMTTAETEARAFLAERRQRRAASASQVCSIDSAPSRTAARRPVGSPPSASAVSAARTRSATASGVRA